MKSRVLLSGDRRCGDLFFFENQELCLVVIDAVEIMLARYDFKLSNRLKAFWQLFNSFHFSILHSTRFKMIKYEADDALAMLRPGEDHLVNVRMFLNCQLFLNLIGKGIPCQYESFSHISLNSNMLTLT